MRHFEGLSPQAQACRHRCVCVCPSVHPVHVQTFESLDYSNFIDGTHLHLRLLGVTLQFHVPEQRYTSKNVWLFLVQHSGTHSHCLLVIRH